MFRILGSAAVLAVLSTGAMAQDVAKGEKVMRKCKACHMVANGDEVLFKGGKTGPNLFGIVGRPAGSFEGYKYSKSMLEAGEKGLVWDMETLAGYLENPSAFLKEYLDDPGAKSKMSLKLKKGREDVISFIDSLGAS